MPPNTVYVGRPTKWGNPFTVAPAGKMWVVNLNGQFHLGMFRDRSEAQQAAIAAYGDELLSPFLGVAMGLLADARHELRGKNLACWCSLDEPCHADVLLEVANA